MSEDTVRKGVGEGMFASYMFVTVHTRARCAGMVGCGCVAALVLGAVAGASATAAQAACANVQIRAQEVYASRLPDCRAYEQVSPVEKNFSDALGLPGLVQSSPSGEDVTYFGLAFPGVQGFYQQVEYLSGRDGGAWASEGLTPSVEPERGTEVIGLTEDLSRTFVEKAEPELEGKPAHHSVYVRDNATGSYQLLAPRRAVFVDATPGASRIIFESKGELGVAGAAPGSDNLYEWEEAKPPAERLSLAGVLSNGEAPIGGASAGPGGPALGGGEGVGGLPGGATSEFYTQDTISEDGSRIFFTEASETGRGIIYMREPEAGNTVQISAGTSPALWSAATPTGNFVFYTEGTNLYRYDVAGKASEPLTTGMPNVVGTLGVSADGSYAYFVAEGVLPGTSGATAGEDNLYEWHVGTEPVFVATLNAGDDQHDWTNFFLGEGPEQGFKSSRVSANGEAVLFASVEKLTSYENRPESGQCEGAASACGELYLYHVHSGIVCVSCNTRAGLKASYSAELSQHEGINHPNLSNMFLTRNLSTDDDRVFFQTREALVPEDINGVMDVYEWEREGTGTCESSSGTFSTSSGGCVYLISTGLSSEESYFGDASASGGDVFFFTRQSLVGQDQDENADLYDAREYGGIAAQNPPPPPQPCSGEVCREAYGFPPVLGAPSSALLLGAGNVASQPKSTKPVKARSKSKPKKKKKKLKKKGDRKASRSARIHANGGRRGHS